LEVIETRKRPTGTTIERAKSTKSVNEMLLRGPERLSSPHQLVKITMMPSKIKLPMKLES
jgi:hypothetical protein